MAQRTVQDLVQARNTVVVSPHTSLAEALLLCRDNGIHRLPVVDDGERLVGLLSASDLRLACESPLFHSVDEIEEKMKSKKVEDAMHKSVQTCELTDNLLTAAKLLRVGGVSGLVVVDANRKVVGVISRTDILDEFIRHLEPNAQ